MGAEEEWFMNRGAEVGRRGRGTGRLMRGAPCRSSVLLLWTWARGRARSAVEPASKCHAGGSLRTRPLPLRLRRNEGERLSSFARLWLLAPIGAVCSRKADSGFF